MEEKNQEPSQEEQVVEDEEADRILPPLLKVKLDELSFKDREILSAGEVLGEFESGRVVAWRKLKPTPVYLDLPLL